MLLDGFTLTPSQTHHIGQGQTNTNVSHVYRIFQCAEFLWTCLFHPQSLHNGEVIVPNLVKRKLRHRQLKWLAPNHTLKEPHCWNQEICASVSPLPSHLYFLIFFIKWWCCPPDSLPWELRYVHKEPNPSRVPRTEIHSKSLWMDGWIHKWMRAWMVNEWVNEWILPICALFFLSICSW